MGRNFHSPIKNSIAYAKNDILNERPMTKCFSLASEALRAFKYRFRVQINPTTLRTIHIKKSASAFLVGISI